LAAGLVLLVAFLFSFSLLSTTVIDVALRLSRALLEQTHITGIPVLELGSRILPYVSTVLLLTFLYGVLPSSRVALVEVLPGALMTSFAWEVAKQGFTVYITSFATYNLIYGSLGAVIAMLLWSYISGVMILLGAEFTVQYARKRRGEAPPVFYEEPKRY
jgi:YihY family inner membrane protein